MSGVPTGWVETTLERVADVKLGRQRSPKNHSGDRMRPYLRAANVTWSGLDLSDVKEMNFTSAESTIFQLEPGDVLLAEASGSPSEVGRPAIWRGEISNCCFQNTLLRVRSRGPLPEYLCHLLRRDAVTGRFGDESRGVGIHHLGAQRLSSWSVPIAPPNEQRRIVDAIEESFSRLDDAHRSIMSARWRLAQLERSVLTSDFHGDWSSEPLVNLTDPTRVICYGILMPKEHIDSGVPYVRVKDIRNNQVNVSGLRRTSPAIAERFRRSSLVPGDVLLTIRGSYGRVAIVPDELDGANITQDTARIAPLPRIDRHFLAAYLRGAPAQHYFQRVARGVAVKGVNIGDLRRLPVPVPPLDDQRRIVAEVERQLSIIEAMDVAIDAALRRSETLRRAILDRAFRGTLVPQDPSDEPASVLLERIAAEKAADQPKRARKRVAKRARTA